VSFKCNTAPNCSVSEIFMSMAFIHRHNDVLLPVGVGCGFFQVWTTAAVNWIVAGISEHPPHDRIQPCVEEVRQKPDMVDWNLVTVFSVRRHAQLPSPAEHRNQCISNQCIGRVSYLIGLYVSMRHCVLTTSGDIVVCFHTAVCLSC